MALKAIKPEIIKPNKPKFLISGKSGVGKSVFALNFPKPYFIDSEGGATREQYVSQLLKNGGAYFGKDQGSQDFKTVLDEIRELATVKHPYQTLVIDSYSKLYNIAAAEAEEILGSDFGRDKKEANKPSRQLLRWIDRLDMTVILICHSKDKWERTKGKEIVFSGTTFDGFEKLEFDLDLYIEVIKTGKERSFVVKKSRIEALQVGDEYPLNYAKFRDLYGKEIIESESKPIVLATPEQVVEANKLIDLLKIDPEQVSKWLSKSEADELSDMTSENIQKIIDFCKKKIETAKESK